MFSVFSLIVFKIMSFGNRSAFPTLTASSYVCGAFLAKVHDIVVIQGLGFLAVERGK